MLKICKYLNNERFIELFRYGITGVATTIVSYITFYLFHYICHIESNLANTISILCAIVFAYISNKFFVFKSKTTTLSSLSKEALSFFAARGFSMLIEIIGYFILYSLLSVDPLISKIIVNVVVLITNYVLSKRYVFNK